MKVKTLLLVSVILLFTFAGWKSEIEHYYPLPVINSENAENNITYIVGEVQPAYTEDKNNRYIKITDKETKIPSGTKGKEYYVNIKEIPEYSGDPYVILNENIPDFSDIESSTEPFEKYSNLDEFGRCGPAIAIVCRETMPDGERSPIGGIKPSGWHTIKYNGLIDGNYLYNRCHLIAYQLCGENDNERNLITGTRFLNSVGMLTFENMVKSYIEETGNHVLYRVSPVFNDSNLLASGVVMEAESIEDHGRGICFNVFVYNVQPGIIIDYKNGESHIDPEYQRPEMDNDYSGLNDKQEMDALKNVDKYKNVTYVINTNTKKFHRPECESVGDMKEKNKRVTSESREEIIDQGYEPCKRCFP